MGKYLNTITRYILYYNDLYLWSGGQDILKEIYRISDNEYMFFG
jgi:hypothetical protein